MQTTVIAEIFILFGLLVASGLLSGTEIALFSLSKLQVRRIRQEHPTRGQLISELIDQPQRLLSTLLFGNTIVNIAAAVVGYDLLQRLFPAHADLLAVPVLTLLILICGEVVPKGITIQKPEFFAPRLAPAIALLERHTRQLRRVFDNLAGRIVRRLERTAYFAQRAARGDQPTTDEYRTMLTVSERAGILHRDERTMVNKILALEKMQVREIMTPRVDMQCVDDSLTPEQMTETLRQYKHRRVPIIHESADSVEAILNVKEFLIDPQRELDEVIELPNFIPGTMSVGKLLKSFRKQEHPVAIVVDEYGGTQGMVTLEDILEEVVGEIEDEFDASEVLIQKVGASRWLVNGKTRLDLVNEQCGLRLQATGVETIAGWMIAQLGSLPKGGERVRVDSVSATARRVVRNRVHEIELEVQA